MKKYGRKEFLELIGLSSLASIGGTFFNKVYGTDIEAIDIDSAKHKWIKDFR